jgi:hypothetical protein
MEEELTKEDVRRRLVQKEIERKLLEKHSLTGSEEQKKPKKVLDAKICWNCKAENKDTSRFCGRCGADLDEEKRRKDRIKNKKMRMEDFDSIDAYLDAVIQEARQLYYEERRNKNKTSSPKKI